MRLRPLLHPESSWTGVDGPDCQYGHLIRNAQYELELPQGSPSLLDTSTHTPKTDATHPHASSRCIHEDIARLYEVNYTNATYRKCVAYSWTRASTARRHDGLRVEGWRQFLGGTVATYLFMRVDFPSGAKIGPSRAAILEGIDKLGSISAASRAVGLTYRQVWATVKVMNEMFKAQLVEIAPEGRASGARLTPLGRKVVAQFREMEDAANRALSPHLKAFERLTGEDPKAPAPVPRWAQIGAPAPAVRRVSSKSASRKSR
jgi:molybdate transport system regulatory protein